MDGKIRVVEVVFTREIAFELEVAEVGFEFLEALLHLGHQPLVVLFLEEFLISQEVAVLLLEILHEGLGVLQAGQLGGDVPGRFGIVPKAGLGGLLFEFLYFPLDLSGVKDDPSLR
jgi:hypothetical protein